MTQWAIAPTTPLDELGARWLAETKHDRDYEETGELYLLHVRAHLAPF